MNPYAWPTESDAYALVPALSLAYYLVVRRHPVERWRIACFALAMLLLVAVFATPLETLALNYLLTAHFLQNVDRRRVGARVARPLVAAAARAACPRSDDSRRS